jgi:hypothetical protein
VCAADGEDGPWGQEGPLLVEIALAVLEVRLCVCVFGGRMLEEGAEWVGTKVQGVGGQQGARLR